MHENGLFLINHGMTSLQTWWWSPQVLAALEDAERDRSGVAWTVRRQWTYQAGHSAFSIGDSSIAAKRESVRSLSSFRGCSCSMPQLGRTEPTEDTKDLHAIKEELVSSSAAAAANDPCMNTLVRALLGREDCRFDDAIARIYALHRGARGGLRGRLHVRSSAEARRLLRSTKWACLLTLTPCWETCSVVGSECPNSQAENGEYWELAASHQSWFVCYQEGTLGKPRDLVLMSAMKNW